MTTRDLCDEVQRLDGEATKGPWRQCCQGGAFGCGGHMVWGEDPERPLAYTQADHGNERANAALIATYRTAAPTLARIVERVEDFAADLESKAAIMRTMAQRIRADFAPDADATALDGAQPQPLRIVDGEVVRYSPMRRAALIGAANFEERADDLENQARTLRALLEVA